MIEAIREIGEYSLKKSGRSVDNPLEILVDNPASKQTKNILFIKIGKEDNHYFYDGIELEEFDLKKLKLYLYRKGTSGNGPDLTPTSMITEIDKTLRVKFYRWFKNYGKKNDLFAKLEEILIAFEQTIKREIEHFVNQETNIISIKINGKYLGEINEFVDFILSQSKENFGYQHKVSSLAENQICSVCKKNKAEVYGYVSTFKFYTVDKPGFVSGGFRQSNAWKNYPVCLECALILEAGKKYLGKQFNFNFYGTKYLLISKFLVNASEEEKKKVFRVFDGERDPKLSKEGIKRLTNDENEALYFLSKFQNYLNLNFLFYSAPKGFDGAVFNVLHYIEDILPSRIKKLFEVKNEIDKIGIFREHLVSVFEKQKKVGEKPLEFNFGILRNFFYNKEERNTISDSYFLEATNKIFSSRPIDYDFILKFIVEKLRRDFSNGYSTQTDTLKGFMLLIFLKKLGLINITKGDRKMSETFFNANGEIKEKVEKFFGEFSDFFGSPEKRAVFLEGVLTQFLLNIQGRERGAQPFRARLKGLKMRESLIKKLLPEIQNKLEEYGKNYYGQLEEIISEHFVQAGENWKLSNDEISFYFTLGMNLSKNFKAENEKKEGENNE